MSRLLAVDWDGLEIRFVLGHQHKDQLSVLQIGSAPITETTDEQGNIRTDMGADLQRILQEKGVGSASTLFALGNSQLNVMYFTLPPSKNEEIPELLKNQAVREMPNYLENRPLDFLMLNDIPTEPRRVLALSLTGEQQRDLQQISRSARRKPAKIEYRSATAAAFVQYGNILPEDDPPVLLVNILADELDLTTLAGRQIINVRNVKLPRSQEPGERTQRIFTEISRTLNIGLQDYSDDSIEHLLLFLGEGEESELLEKLEKQNLQVRTINPLENAKVKSGQMPEHPGRYAALLGAILCEAAGRKPAVDLLHPKSKPKPPNYAAIVLIVFMLLLFCAFGFYILGKREIARLEKEKNELDKTYKELYALHQQWATPYVVLSNAVVQDKADAVWLDVIRDIIPHFPEQQDMMVNQMSFVSGPDRRVPNSVGRIEIRAIVRDHSVVAKLKHALESKGLYRLYASTPIQNPSGGTGYPWSYTINIFCARVANPQIYSSFLSEELRIESRKPPEQYQQIPPDAAK